MSPQNVCVHFHKKTRGTRFIFFHPCPFRFWSFVTTGGSFLLYGHNGVFFLQPSFCFAQCIHCKDMTLVPRIKQCCQHQNLVSSIFANRLSKLCNMVSLSVLIPLVVGPSAWSTIFNKAMLGMMQEIEASALLISNVTSSIGPVYQSNLRQYPIVLQLVWQSCQVLLHIGSGHASAPASSATYAMWSSSGWEHPEWCCAGRRTSSFWMALRCCFARTEWLKWVAHVFNLAMMSPATRWLLMPSFTTSCNVCALQLKSGISASLRPLIISAPSHRTSTTLSWLMPQSFIMLRNTSLM